ncbi:MAG: helix-turn-helix domain-containing protein [Raineya sp.]|nr:helix-turn-helix domain-containing protein [Raineya sp.]
MINPFEHLNQSLCEILQAIMNLTIEVRQLRMSDKEYLNIDEASKLLSLTKKTIHNFTSQGKIPHFKKGKRLYFERQKLLEWLTAERNAFNSKKKNKV